MDKLSANPRIERVIDSVVCLIIGTLFIYSGLNKIMNIDKFNMIVENYNLLPRLAVRIFSSVIPYVEFILGSFIFLGLLVKVSSILICVNLLIFTIAIIINIIRDIRFSCGCFSLSLEPGTRSDYMIWLFRDLVLIIMSLKLILTKRRVV